jgi:hypothetical protein
MWLQKCKLPLFILFITFYHCIPTGVNKTPQRAQTIEADDSYDATVGPGGEVTRSILLHSRMGIRVAMNLDKQELELWISPQAGKSVDNRYRNFSCRDDHTSIFDKIWFPELAEHKFIKCDYDPFHTVLHYEGQTIHLATLLNEPVVLLWAEQEEVVDFKSDKQDSLLAQSEKYFGVRHPDRDLTLDFFATLGGKGGKFQHSPEVMRYRSKYARTVLNADQFLVIGGELVKEDVKSIVTEISKRKLVDLLVENEKKIAKATETGSVKFKNAPEMQKLYNINQRHMLSAQDASGAIRAALRYVYYLIWATDGSVSATSMMQTGDKKFLRLWCEYMLANPTTQERPPEGRFYGQLVNRTLTKREEFGSLCAVWPAFMYWGLTGDDRFVSGDYLELLIDVVNWMERYCYDSTMQAIGTYYLGGGSEDPFLHSPDFGYDMAVGSFMNRDCYAPTYQGEPILRAYEFNMNLNQYNMYLMLAAVTEEETSQKYIEKAQTITKFLHKLDSLEASAYYRLQDKGLVLVKREEGELEKGTFAVQNNAPAYFMPNFPKYFMNRMKSFQPFTDERLQDEYAVQIYGRLAGLDTRFVDETDILKSLEVTLPYQINPSKYIPMPYTMVEYFGAEPGSFHDIRPQAFTTAPFQAAITNLAIRTMPFGIALRGTNYLNKLENFQYLNSRLNIDYSGEGKIESIKLNQNPLQNTLQIPDRELNPGSNDLQIDLNKTADKDEPLLIYSTVRLLDVNRHGNIIRYQIQGYCQNVLVFENLNTNFQVIDSQEEKVRNNVTTMEGFSFIEFFGKGEYKIEVKL